MEKLNKEKSKSLKITFIRILFIAISIVILLSMITIITLLNIRESIFENRVILIESVEVNREGEEIGEHKTERIPLKDIPFAELSCKDRIIVGTTTVLIIVLPTIYMLVAIYLVYIVFFKKKLKKPLVEIEKGLDNILNNNLDFSLKYNGNDELSKLFDIVEKIKNNLYENNLKMWETENNKKALDRSISHDLRTPITVIKGYLEYLELSINNNKIEKEKILEIIEEMKNSTFRLESYIDSVSSIQKLEDIELNIQSVDTFNFKKELKNEVKLLFDNYEIKYEIHIDIKPKKIFIDKEITFRVLENLLNNSLRYAKEKIIIEIKMQENYLKFDIIDDGKGFDEEERENATKLFYKKENENHYGLGLYICKVLCEKHNGKIRIDNLKTGGAKISVTFENIF